MHLAYLPLSLLSIVLLSAACDGREYPEGPFKTVELARYGGGEGFCASEGEALDATISQRAGEWILQSTIAVVDRDETDQSQCLDTFSDACMKSEVLAPITLTAEQVSQVQAAIDGVPSRNCDVDENLECDWCIITNVRVDGLASDDACCGCLNQEFSDGYGELSSLIDQLSR